MSKSVANATQWRNRIVGHSEEEPDQLLAHESNFRRHPGGQRDALRGSLNGLGWVKSVLVNRLSGKVVDGHARVEEALSAGCKVPVDWVELTPEEERLALAVLDPISEMATRDDEALAALLADVSTSDAGLQALLDSMGAGVEVESGLAAGIDEDAVPEPPAEAITKPGDVILLGRHRLMCGDSTVVDEVARLMDGAKANCMWTDPPYGVNYTGKTKDALTIKNDSGFNLRELLDEAFACATVALEGGASIYVAHPPGALNVVFGNAFLGAGWRLHETLIWDKGTIVLGHSDYHFAHEPIFYGYTPGEGRFGRGGKGWYGDDSQRSILTFPKPSRNESHPTMKPVALVEYCLGNSTRPGDKVLDLFGGSGSTLIACEKTGRTAYLMELDPRYCDVIVKRWEEATGRKAERCTQ
jgi:DNA modification methylase